MVTRLDITFDGVTDVPRLSGQTPLQFFDGFMGYYSQYVGDDRFVANATLTGSGWTLNTLRLVGEDNISTVSDADAGGGRRITLLQLGRNSDVDLKSTQVEFIYGWNGGDKHSITLGDQHTETVKSIAIFAALNEITTGNMFVESIVTTTSEPSVADIRIGSGGAGSVRTSDGNDKIALSDGFVQSIATNGGNDRIATGDGYVRMIDAGEGNDTITMGDGGGSFVIGAGGNDKFLVNELPNRDWGITFWGDSGTDTIDFKKVAQGVAFSLWDSGYQAIGGLNSNTDRAGFLAATVTENISGTRFADELTGSSVDNKLFGRGGNDRLAGLEGNDLLIGAKGKDTFVFGANGGTDNVRGYSKKQDTIEIADHSGGFRALNIEKVGKNLEIDYDGGTIVLMGRGDLSLSANDFDFI